jgi:hypothetical protein
MDILYAADANPENKALSFGKSKAKLVSDKAVKITLPNVAGIEAKEEVQEIIDFLKSPRNFQNSEAKYPGRAPCGRSGERPCLQRQLQEKPESRFSQYQALTLLRCLSESAHQG